MIVILLFQAGPLEKVSRKVGKPMAFVTYRHSISLPYAKELYQDTRLHNRMLKVAYRTGSIHEKREQQINVNQRVAADRNRDFHGNRSGPQINQSRVEDRFQVAAAATVARASSYPMLQGTVYSPVYRTGHNAYRSSGGSEYVPQFVSMDNPPASFMGATPINHPDHHVSLSHRRDRLLRQQQHTRSAPYKADRNQGYHGYPSRKKY